MQQYRNIAIDCGHNIPRVDTGAESKFGQEDTFTREVGDRVIELLRLAGRAAVDVTPKSATSVSDSLRRRAINANDLDCDLLVSIHFNAFNGSAHGSEVFAVSPKGREVARSVLGQICALGFKNRGVKDGSRLLVLNASKMPAILVECCFLDSGKDMGLYSSDPDRMARAIAAGILGEAPAEGGENLSIEVTDPTFLKASPQQAANLLLHEKAFLRPGADLPITSWVWEGQHVKVQLAEPLGNLTTVYAFADHVEIQKNNRPLVLNSPKDDTGPNLARTQIESNPQPTTSDRGLKVEIPSYGTIYLNDPIHPGGHFSWSEALHGGERIPKQKSHVDNILQLALRAEDARERCGDVPLIVTSWYRPEPWNSRAGGASKSTHKFGQGIDLKHPHLNGAQMRKILDPIWPGGLGTYGRIPQIIHLDCRPYRARW